MGSFLHRDSTIGYVVPVIRYRVPFDSVGTDATPLPIPRRDIDHPWLQAHHTTHEFSVCLREGGGGVAIVESHADRNCATSGKHHCVMEWAVRLPVRVVVLIT